MNRLTTLYLIIGIMFMSGLIGFFLGFNRSSQKDNLKDLSSSDVVTVENNEKDLDKYNLDEQSTKLNKEEPGMNLPDINTDNWIQYRNRTLNFTMRYPNGWKIKENQSVKNSQKEHYILLAENEATKETAEVVINVYLDEDLPLAGEEKILGSNTYLVQEVDKAKKYFLKKDNNLFEIIISDLQNVKKQSTIEEILKTIKF